MKVYFWHRHVRDTVAILKEGNPPHPRFPLCDMLVPWKVLNGTHRHTAQCNRGAERKRQILAVEEEREVTVRTFRTYGRPLEMVKSFRYLGWVISEAEKQLAGSGEELVPVKGGLEEDGTHTQQGGGGAAVVRIIF